jgi:hypothetical protein
MYLALRQSIVIIAINMASRDTGNGRTKEIATHVYSHPQEHVSHLRPVIYVGIRHVCIIPVARIRLLINKVIVGIVTKQT